MVVSIHQPHYLLWLPYLSKIVHSDSFIVLDDVEFTKNGYQNRNQIKTSQGALVLSVPVKQKLAQTIEQVQVLDDGWRKKHWSSIRQAYARAPFFSTYEAELASFYEEPWPNLVEPVTAMTVWLLQALRLSIPVVRSSSLAVKTSSSQRLVDLVRKVGGDTYLSGSFALSAYLDPLAFQGSGVALQLFDWSSQPYQQLHSSRGFVPNLAALDALLNLGPEATVELLKSGGRSRLYGPADTGVGNRS